MAAASIEQDIKDEKITYGVIVEQDTEQVLKLLKNTFFKVKYSIYLNRNIFPPSVKAWEGGRYER